MTLKDIGLLISLATNVFFIWFIARRTGTSPGSSSPGGAATPFVPARPLSDGDLARVRDALSGGNKIQAIKVYREITGCGLKDAKDAVDAMERDG